MTGPIEDYLRELAASLHTRPPETGRILAEAEDHLRESMAAGLAAGLTETEAAEAAISAFGSVRAVVRAHQTRRGQAAALAARVAMTAWGVVSFALMSVFAVVIILGALVSVTAVKHASPVNPAVAGRPGRPGSPVALEVMLASAPAGVIVLGGYLIARRRLRARRGQKSSSNETSPVTPTW
jgi:hypothetical protein